MGLERADGGYRLTTESDTLEAGQVIVATGAYQNPSIPPIADGLSAEVTQLHSAAYRNPAQIPAGTVLIVGSANSGCQIATDLHGGDHHVHLAVTGCRQCPTASSAKACTGGATSSA